jgi:YidC/Oxa1 family membrane protein insertase
MQNFFSPLSDFFFTILRFLHENLSISWPWAIVVLTIIIRVVLIPLTWRQIKSMRAMQALQPHVKALQEKYKNDRQLLNQKLMEFYRDNKVSPFGSCLPLLLQMPVFLGLFYMLQKQGRVNAYLDAGAFAAVWHSHPTSWLWIADITKFDLGLMFLYIGSQFGSSWQMARRSPGQQRTIAIVMPLVFGVMMYLFKWPAGLMIYWFTSNLWGIAQQFVAEKIMPVHVPVPPPEEKEKKTTPRRPAAKGSARPVGKSGGKTSGQKTGQKAKTTGSQSQRPNRGTGSSKGSGGT